MNCWFAKLLLRVTVVILLVVLLGVYFQAGYANSFCEIPKVVFEYQHVNFAWQPLYKGWFIDDVGNLKCYKLTGANCREWKQVDQDGFIAEDDLGYNYSLAKEEITTIPSEEISEKSADMEVLINNGEISQPVHVGYDRGFSAFVCYLWDSEKGKYKRILLHREGNYNQTNLHPKAVELTEWLSGINKKYFNQ